jgi:hypothetical protein
VSSNRFRLFLSLVVFAALSATTAAAQTNPVTNPSETRRGQDTSATQPDTDAAPEAHPSTVPKWEFEAHGGISAIFSQSGGSGSLPSTGAIVGGLIGASSFYLGDGAALFNQNQSAPAIVPLDALLLGPAIREQSVGTFGLRIGRTLKHRIAVEGTADLELVRISFAPATLTGIEASRASYIPALQRALSSASVTSAVTSVATIADRQLASHIFLGGTLIINLKEEGKAIPYLAVGAGAVFHEGATPAATLVGTYQLGSPAQIIGTDTVTLRYAQNGPTLFWTGGGGVKYLFTPKYGIRLDARAQLYRDPTVNLIDVTPAAALESTGAPFPIIKSGALQFSSTAPLTGAAATGATTFTGNGLQAHVVFAAGFFLRF